MSTNRASNSPASKLRCRPPEPEQGETADETLARYRTAFDEFAQCIDDELTIRPESSLLSRVVLKILLPFAVLSAALSQFYASTVVRTRERFPHIEYGFGAVHLALALALIALWLIFRRTGHFPRIRRIRAQILAYLDSRTPRRNETLTRNHMVNGWIYFWFVFGVVFFVPAVFFLFRADAFDRAGMNVIVDTAGICESGGDGITIYRGSDTCATITGSTDGSSANQAEAAEIRLDGTTTLTIYAIVLVTGILVSMVLWWQRDRTSRRVARSSAQTYRQ